MAYLEPNVGILPSRREEALHVGDLSCSSRIEPGVVSTRMPQRQSHPSDENSHFHFQSNDPAYGKYKSYSYRFDTPDRVIFFTGDTGPSDAEKSNWREGARHCCVTETNLTRGCLVPVFKKNGVWELEDSGRKRWLFAFGICTQSTSRPGGHRKNGRRGSTSSSVVMTPSRTFGSSKCRISERMFEEAIRNFIQVRSFEPILTLMKF